MNTTKLCSVGIVASLLAVALTADVTRAGVTSFDVYKTTFYEQTSDAQPVDPTFARFDSRVFISDPDDLSSVTTTYDGASSPLVYYAETDTIYRYSQSFASQAEMDAIFPDGATYWFEISGGSLGDQTALLDSPSESFYPSEIPFLTGSTFSQLQGFDPTGSLSISWNGFSPGAEVDVALIFFTIFRASDLAVVFDQSFLASDVTSVLLPGNTLDFGTEYLFDFVYSNRIFAPEVGFDGVRGQAAFDRRTVGTFTTSGVIPEPSSGLLFGSATVLVGLFVRIRRMTGRAPSPRLDARR